MTRDERPPSGLAKAAALLLALLPPARMAWIVFTHGENNLSNDYVGRVPLVISMLDGTCTVGKFVREAWIGGGHSLIALVPIYYLNARFFDWSVWIELGLGLALVAATLVLLTGAVPRSKRWLLLPLLSLLVFSTTKVSSFTFGESALQMGLAQLGLAIGVLGFAKSSDRPVRLAACMAAGGLLASWSWGGGIMVWPVFFLALAFLRVRAAGPWLVLVAGAASGLAQYAWLLPGQVPVPTAVHVSLAAKGRLFLDVLGRPFVNGIAHADPNPWSQAIGAVGLILMAATLIALRTKLREQAVPLLLLSWTLLVALQIAMFRAGVAPWYASPMALFWAGLLMLLVAAPSPFRVGGILVVALLASRVQYTWEDKSFYLPSRSPASAACLREWRTAPSACHARVFQWGEEGHEGELARLGEPLERNRLSVFGSRRTYLLQGDAFLGNVTLEPASARSFFTKDGTTSREIDDVDRLDFVLTPDSVVAWRADLPSDLRDAQFSTLVRTVLGESQSGRAAHVSVTSEESPIRLDGRAFLSPGKAAPLSLDLSPLAGKKITLRLTAEETHEGKAPLVFEAPKIELRLGR